MPELAILPLHLYIYGILLAVGASGWVYHWWWRARRWKGAAAPARRRIEAREVLFAAAALMLGVGAGAESWPRGLIVVGALLLAPVFGPYVAIYLRGWRAREGKRGPAR